MRKIPALLKTSKELVHDLVIKYLELSSSFKIINTKRTKKLGFFYCPATLTNQRLLK